MLFHWILTHLHFFHGFLLAGAAGLGLPDLGSGTEGAVVNDTPTDGADSTDGTVDDSATQDGTESTDGSEGETEPQAKEETKIDWRTVPPEVKSHIQEISKTNPKLANLLQNAVYTSNSMLKEFPGGLKEVKALKGTIDELGGLEEIQTLKTTYNQVVEEQETLDSQAREGNPQVLDNLVQIAGQEGFSKLMAPALDKWSTTDPAGYSHVMGKVIVNALQQGGVVNDINFAFRMLKLNTPEATAEAVECLKKVATWANEINKVAVNAPEKPKVDPAIQQQQERLDQQAAQLFNKEFSGNFGSWRNNRINDEIKGISNGRALTEYQTTTLGQRVVQEIQSILTSDPEYMKTLNKIYATRDMAELLKFTKNRTDKLLPEATKKAYRSLFANPGKKQVAPAAKAKPVTTPTGTTAAAVQSTNWTKVTPDKAPAPGDIDMSKTDFTMKFRQQAILKNGQRVYWGKHVPENGK